MNIFSLDYAVLLVVLLIAAYKVLKASKRHNWAAKNKD